MNQNYFPVIKSTLSADALGELIRKKYGFSHKVNCELMARGVNDIYILKSDKKSYAVRVLRTRSRTEEEINYEIELMQFYSNNGFSCAKPILSNDNEFFIPILAPEGERYLTLFNWVEGTLLSESLTKENVFNFGKHIAKMHNINHKFTCSKEVMVDSSSYIKKYLPDLIKLLGDKKDILFYEKLVENACKKLDQIDRVSIPFGATHGDIHFRNVFVTNDKKFTLIDWDTCGNDFLFKELVSFTWLTHYIGESKEINKNFMNGYREIRKPKKEEEELYSLFFCIRHLHIICGVSKSVNIIGHNITGFNHSLDKYKKIANEAGTNAGLI